VSRRHASLLIAGGAVQVTDLGSTNGTYLNGRRAEPVAVADLDGPVRIGLGQEVMIVLQPGCDR
jgi:pSer/pThr/pTyr-binding forkhead associated (FHA) protein